METPNYPTAFRERWYLIVVGALLGVLAAVALGAALPRSYEASATLFLQVDSPESSLLERSQFAQARVKSYPDLVASPQVLEATIDDLALGITPQQLATRLSASNPRDTVLLTVTASAPSAELAALTANAVAEHLSDLVDDLESDVRLTLTLPAAVPTSQASPQPIILIGLGLLGGLAVGAIAVAAFAQLDPRVRSVPEVRSLTGLPVVGQLPPGLARTLRRGESTPAVDEALRATVVNQRLLAGEQRRRVVAFVPAGAGARDDAVDAVAGLARTIRTSGRSVLVLATEPTPPHGTGAFLHRVRAVFESWPKPKPQDAVPAITHRTLPAASDQARSTALLRAVATGISRHHVVLVVADAATDVFALADIAGVEVVVVADRRHTSRSSLIDAATSLEFAGTRPLAVLMANVGSRSRVDLPATWEEDDRVAPVPVEVTLPEPAAKPARRATTHRPRRKTTPAATTEDSAAEPPPAGLDADADEPTASEAPALLELVDEPLPGFEPEPEPA
jgi:capsular polysaccharide biosynthesis protein